MMHDTNYLLAAHALDAVDRGEKEGVERHLAECPRCQSELDAYRDVAAAMGNSVAKVPDDLWRSISSRLQRHPAKDSPSMPVLMHRAFGRRSDDGAPEPLGVPSARWRRPALGAIAIAAASIVAVLGLSLSRADRQDAQLRAPIGETTHPAVVAALGTPGHRLVNLTGENRRESARFVLLPDGRGYLVRSDLPSLPPLMTYQLWGVIDGQPISLGLLGRSPNQVTFTLAGAPPRASVIGINVEPAGGAEAPSAPMVVKGIA